MNKKLKNKKGFTLIEVIISIAIFAIASVMLIGIIYTASQIALRASAKYSTQLKAAEGFELLDSGREVDPDKAEIAGDSQEIIVVFGNPD